jgi:hypothetical protein
MEEEKVGGRVGSKVEGETNLTDANVAVRLSGCEGWCSHS